MDPLDALPLPPPGGRPDALARPSAANPGAPIVPGPSTAPVRPRPRRAAERPREATSSHSALAPAASTRAVTSVEKVALAVIEAELGGRQQLISYLAQANLDDWRTARFFRMLCDPENDALSLAEICGKGGCSIRKVQEAVYEALRARSHLLSEIHIAAGLPSVARTTMEDALPGEKMCTKCNGVGKYTPEPAIGDDSADPNPEPMTCITCFGKGTVQYEPELGLRKLALGLGGLGEKSSGAGTKVQINNINKNALTGGTAAETFEKLTVLTDKLMYGDGRSRLRQAAGDEEAVDGELAE